MALISPSFLVDCCVIVAAMGKMTRKMVSVSWQFCVKIGELQRTHIVFYTKIHSLPLTFSYDQGSERPELAGSKMAQLFLPVRHNLEIHALYEFRWKWVFFSTNWFLGDLRVGTLCHDSGKGWCIVRIDGASMFGKLFCTGFGYSVVTMVVSVFLYCVILTLQCNAGT